MKPYFIRIFFQHLAFGFMIPVNTVFFLQRGLSLSQIALIQSVFAIFTILLEVPTGVIADKYGRKTSLVLSNVINGTSFLLYVVSQSMPFYLLAAFAESMGFGLMSGAHEAYVYDGLKEKKHESMYRKVFSRLAMTDESGTILGMLISSLLILSIGVELIFVATAALLFVVAIYSAIFLKEPKLHISHNNNATEQFEQHPKAFIVRALQIVKQHSYILFMMFGFALLAQLGHLLWHPQLLAVGIPLALFGVLFASMKVFALLGSFVASKMKQKTEIMHFYGIGFVMFLACLVMSIHHPIAAPAGLALLFFTVNIFAALQSEYLNDRFPSKQRATLLSANSMMSGVVISGLVLFLGFSADHWGLAAAFLILGSVKIFAFLPLLIAQAQTLHKQTS